MKLFSDNLLGAKMKIIVLSLAAVAVWSTAEFAIAEPQAQGANATQAAQPMESVTVKARRFHMEPQQFSDYEYAYVLDNKEQVRFSRKAGRFFVTLKGQPAVEIFAASTDQFETKNGAKLVFSEGGESLTIDHFEALWAASVAQAAAKSKVKK